MAEPAASCSTGQVSLEFIKRNGGTILLHSGHQFYARRKHKSGLTVWACTKRNNCKGILRIKDLQILDETAHNHAPDFAKNEIEQSLHKLKTELHKPGFPNVPQKYNSMLSDLKDTGMNIISDIPKFTSIKSTLYRQRNAEAEVRKMRHNNPLEVEVPSRYLPFLLADYLCDINNTRIIVFSSVEARKIMFDVKDFFGDGTFKSCPLPFAQLYTIHADTGSTTDYTNIVPVVYALMSNRKKESYVILFEMIKSQLPGWKPLNFKCDYEKATMQAIATVFPMTKVKGCYYHYNKAVFKKGKELKMTTSQDIKEVRLIQLSAVLPLLPEDEIINGWVYILARYGDSDTIGTNKFVKYMENQWLRQEFLKVWCVFGQAHRTTNALEAWHHKLNKAIGIKNPNIMHFLQKIKEDSSENHIKNVLKEQNKSLKRKRSKKIILKDEFIQKVQNELTQGLLTIGHALEMLRH